MEYTITSHNDADKKFNVICKGYNIEVSYPSDVNTFSELTSDALNLILSGVLLPYENMPEYSDNSSEPTIPGAAWL